MEIILLPQCPFYPADRSGLYLQSGEGSSKRGPEASGSSLERWKSISLLRHKRDLEVVCQPVFTETGGIEGETLLSSLCCPIRLQNDVHFQKNMVISGDNASGNRPT